MQTDQELGWRIRRYDSLNLVVEQFHQGGEMSNLGKLSKDRWTSLGYYPNLKEAALGLLSKASCAGVSSTHGQNVLEAIEAAKVVACQAVALAESKQAVSGGAT